MATNGSAIRQFRVGFPEAELTELRRRVNATRWPERETVADDSQGVRLASDAVRVGAGGHRYFFVHPASTGGVLLEIVGDGVALAGLSEGRD